jgi:hypothetical protein
MNNSADRRAPCDTTSSFSEIARKLGTGFASRSMMTKNQQQYHGSKIIREVLCSPGFQLDLDIRSQMETRFGRDFSRVRIHTDHVAAVSARTLSAQAYTAGSHIVFGEGRYKPATRDFMWLLAHELAHVVQQRIESSRSSLKLDDLLESLEREADWVADLIVSDRSLPRGFVFSAAPVGMIQCHDDVPCPGTKISAAPKSIYGPANEAIEIAYKEDSRNRKHGDAIFFGSQFESRRDVLVPSGAPNKKFANLLLSKLRGITAQRRPDIIDFTNRVFYEIKSADDTRKGTVQLASYYILAEEIRHEYAASTEPPWRVEYATWYPPHVLPLGGDPLNKIVCTQATDHKRFPGLILYDVRELSDDDRRRRGVRRAIDYELVDFEQGFAELLPAIRAQLPNAVRFYDVEYPNYVVIIPQDYYRAWYKKRNDQMMEK